MILLDTTMNVHYRYLYLLSESAGGMSEGTDATRGQVNGLCGAAVPGELSMITGTHTGPVHVTVELHDAEPALGDGWEEAVEVPFASSADDLILSAFQDSTGPLDLPPGNYRVRYSARGMGLARDADATTEPIDHYLLQFWPSGDRVVRQTSTAAAYWHTEPIPRPCLEDRVAAVRLAREQRLAAAAKASAESAAEPPPPSAEPGFAAAQLTRTDPALAAALAAAGDQLRRDVALWAAEDALRQARSLDAPWAVSMLAAIRRGENPLDLPEDPSAGGGQAYASGVWSPDGTPGWDPEFAVMAVQAVHLACDPDTLAAASGALLRPGRLQESLLLRVRRAFPELGL